MSIRKFAAAIALVFMTAFVAFGNDAAPKKGTPTLGQIASVADSEFQMKTATGTVKVTFNQDTRFEHGGEVVDKTHLSKGAKVTVFGTKSPSGEIVASDVVLAGSNSGHKH